MIDKRLYQETFSHLRASDQAKQEVFQKMQEMKHRKRMPRVLRGAAIAAAMVMALAVTAGAVNVATDGEFFRQFTIVWTSGNQYLAQDNQGNEVYVTVAAGEPVTKENGRLILHAQGEERLTSPRPWRPRVPITTPTIWMWCMRTAAGRPGLSPLTSLATWTGGLCPRTTGTAPAMRLSAATTGLQSFPAP